MIIRNIKNQQLIYHLVRTTTGSTTCSCTGKACRISGAKVESIVNIYDTRYSGGNGIVATRFIHNYSNNNTTTISNRQLLLPVVPVLVAAQQQKNQYVSMIQTRYCNIIEQHRIRYFSTTKDNSNSLVTDANNIVTTTAKNNNNEQLVSADGIVGNKIDFDIAAKIEGNESQIVTIQLEPGQIIRAESGSMMYMTDGIVMNTTTGTGGISSGFQRVLTGQNFFISDFTYQPSSPIISAETTTSTTTQNSSSTSKKGIVAFGTDFPSKIIRLNIQEYNNKLICQKGALLCANHTIDIQMEFSKNFTTGFFGGEGFVLQGLTGIGDVFLKASGTLIKRTLQSNEQLRISSGCLVAFSNGIDYDVQMVKGFTNVFAGGEGLFITTLTGPGTVWLQGQPPQRMISEISRRVPSGGGIGLAIPIPGMGGSSGGSTTGSSGTESTG